MGINMFQISNNTTPNIYNNTCNLYIPEKKYFVKNIFLKLFFKSIFLCIFCNIFLKIFFTKYFSVHIFAIFSGQISCNYQFQTPQAYFDQKYQIQGFLEGGSVILYGTLKAPSLVGLIVLVGTFKKEKVLVGAFSGHG